MASPSTQDVLLHLVSLEPRELCNEAVIEKCRATRDLRSCGRIVQHALTSCGHAPLCAECCQRCDVCPICRLPIRCCEPVMRLRLYDQCVQAGLIHPGDEEHGERDGQYSADVQHLWSFFDIALENNLVSVISDYVADVCLDADAVSSSPIVSILLDGTVVKDWCLKVFSQIMRSLQEIYSLGTRLLKTKLGILEKVSARLDGVSHVLETLAPPSDMVSASFIELQRAFESVCRASQHLEVMCWCARFGFLEGLPSRHSTITAWRTAVTGRKLAAASRAWPENVSNAPDNATCETATLFIEDAMSTIGCGRDTNNEAFLELRVLRLASVTPSGAFRWRDAGVAQHGSTALYPPESLHSCVDLIFLEASADHFLAKKAIFLYYLFDRQWPQLDGEAKAILDDYVHTFNIPRHVMLESLLFLLLDDNSDTALEQACTFLPEIVTSEIHPKVSCVFLERNRPKVALDVLRCSEQGNWMKSSGSTGEIHIPTLSEAINAVRIRVECGLLTEAFLYARSYASKLKAVAQEDGILVDRHSTHSVEHKSLHPKLELLVRELCWLCAQKNILEKMIELPWQEVEERIILKCLLQLARQNPCSSSGSLMVLFYIMRCRYQEAYVVHKRVCAIEKDFIEHCLDEDKKVFVRKACMKRTILVEKGIEMLPQAVREQLQYGTLDNVLHVFDDADFNGTKDSSFYEQSVMLSNKVLPEMKSGSEYKDLPLKVNAESSISASQTKYVPFDGFHCPQDNGGLFSPILGRRLIYTDDCTPVISKGTSKPFFEIDHSMDNTHKHLGGGLESLDSPLTTFQGQTNEDVNSGPIHCYLDTAMEEIHRGITHGSERTQNGGLLLAKNGSAITLTSMPFHSSYMKWKDQSSLKEEQHDEELFSLRSNIEPSSLDLLEKQTIHTGHFSPSGKRKAYGNLDGCQAETATRLSLELSGHMLGEDKLPHSENKVKHSTLLEGESIVLNAEKQIGLRWRAEDNDSVESVIPSNHCNKPPLPLKRAINGSRLLKSRAL